MNDVICTQDSGCNTALINLKNCVKQKIGYKTLVITLAGIFVAATPFTIYGLKAWAKEKEKMAAVEKQVEVIKTHYDHIQKEITEIKEQQMTPEQLRTLLKGVVEDAIKKNNNEESHP